MKYRVRMDMSFTVETDARLLMDSGKALAEKAVSAGEVTEKDAKSFCEMEVCRHDEGLPCTLVERVAIIR
ncbi:MAG: hypothetical protein Q8O43_04045 [Dehalococcoidia bacterium]|nr:hypothetical protein [Dehalococcoidia bacterium]